MKKGIAIILMAMLIAIPCIAGCTGLVGEPIVGKWDMRGVTYTFTSDGKYTASRDGGYTTSPDGKYTTRSYVTETGTWKVEDREGDEIEYSLYDENGRYIPLGRIYYVPKTDTVHYILENNQYHRV